MDEMREILYLFPTHNQMNPTVDFSNRTLERIRETIEVLMGLLLFVEYLFPSCPLMMSVSTFPYISLSPELPLYALVVSTSATMSP